MMNAKKIYLSIFLLFSFKQVAFAEEKKGFLSKLNPFRREKAPAPTVVRQPEVTDLGPSTPKNRSSITIPLNRNQQAAQSMVQQRANQSASTRQQRALSPEEQNLDLPNFFSQNGNPKIPTVRNADGTYITESFFTGLASHTIQEDFAFRGHKLSDLIGDAPNLSSLQDMAHTGLITYFAEHPGLGGNPDRGFRPQFMPSFVRFVLETYPLMLESGELLYPQDRALQYIATGKPIEQKADINPNYKVAFNEAHIAMTDTDGNLLGPNMYPIFSEAKIDAEDNLFFTSDKWREISAYSKGFESFFKQQVMMTFPIPDYSGAFREHLDRRTAREELYTVTPLSDCYKFILKLKFKTARECFRQRKDELMYRELTGTEDYSTLKDFRDAAFRGAVAGGIVTEISGAMDLGTGIGVGALANTLRMAYNKYLRKEDQFTQEQFDSLMSFVNMYTFAPGPDGMINPKVGMWKVYENGIILRYKEEAVITGYRREADGNRTPVTGMRDFPIDLYGRERTAEVGFRISLDAKKNPDEGNVRAYGHLVDIRRSQSREAKRAKAQLDFLGGTEEVIPTEIVAPKEEPKNPPPRAVTPPTTTSDVIQTGPVTIPPLPRVTTEVLNSFGDKLPVPPTPEEEAKAKK